jgi:hypothetical protein
MFVILSDRSEPGWEARGVEGPAVLLIDLVDPEELINIY